MNADRPSPPATAVRCRFGTRTAVAVTQTELGQGHLRIPSETLTKPPPAHRSRPDLSRQESLDFELLFLLENEPGLSQREIADRLGISLGRANYCVKALLDKGALKLANFKASSNKLGYVYVLTPSGIAARASMTARFLQRKLADYERLKHQIEALRQSLDGTGS